MGKRSEHTLHQRHRDGTRVHESLLDVVVSWDDDTEGRDEGPTAARPLKGDAGEADHIGPERGPADRPASASAASSRQMLGMEGQEAGPGGVRGPFCLGREKTGETARLG